MTDSQAQDPQAIVDANNLLADPDATVEQLIEARKAVNDELRQVEKAPRIEPHMATSQAQLRELKAALAERSELADILTRLYRRLTDAMQHRRAQDAIVNADEVRAQMATALEQAEAAYREYRRLAGELATMGKAIAQDKQAAGHGGQGKIGLKDDVVKRIMALEPVQNTAEARRFERGIALEG
jgi:flagellin-specific chaperone FliS